MSASTPLEAVAASAAGAPSGHVVQTGVDRLKTALHGHASEFADWRREPMTRAVLSALQCAFVHPPAGLMGDSALVQYGVTQGLAYAMQLLTDPSTLWPGVFGDSAVAVSDMPEMDFETSLDEALK